MMPQALATQPIEPSAVLKTAPRQIGRFQVRAEIGRGSNGVVYAAYDPFLGREVAIKAIPLADNEYRRQIEASFLQEAKSAAGLSHPGIVTVFDAGKSDSIAYIAMERLYGCDLHDWLSTHPPMSPHDAAAMMARVADAVHYAHRRGVIHRDIKPSNIFLNRDHKPKVLDFGVALAQRSQDRGGEKRQLIGTPNYMSPEQALGKTLDARSDVFSIGSILYEALTGRRAFDGGAVEDTLAAVTSQEPQAISATRRDVPQALVDIVTRALSKDPADRYQTAGALRNDLAAFANGEPVPQPRPPTPRLLRLPIPEPARAYLLPGGVALVGLLAAGFIALSGHQPPAVAPAAPLTNTQPAQAAAPDAATAPAGGQQAVRPTRSAERADARHPATAAPHKKNAASTAAATASAAAPAAAEPPPPGTITLAIVPWGEVFVDNARLGVSPPLTHLSLVAGPHTIVVRNGDASPYVAEVAVQPGQTLALQHRF